MIQTIVKAVVSPLAVIVLGIGVVTTAAVTSVTIAPMTTPEIIYVEVTPEPTPSPSLEPSPEPTATPTPTPTPEVDVTLPSLPLPVIQPPIVVPPLPSPSCFHPGGSGDSSGMHTGWDAQLRECAGKPTVTILALCLVLMYYRMRHD